MENWKQITFKNTEIEVSDLGNVRRLKPNGEYFLYKKTISADGYVQCSGGSVHSLVAIAFLGHTPNGHSLVVHHKDSNPSNNKLSNLEVVTQSQNILAKEREKTSMYDYVYATNKGFSVSMNTGKGARYFGSFENEDDAGRVAKLVAEIFNK